LGTYCIQSGFELTWQQEQEHKKIGQRKIAPKPFLPEQIAALI